MIFGERAASLAEAAGLDKLWVRAESLVVSARVRLGLRASTVSRAVAALRAAEDLGETVLAAELRTDLAVCARSVGSPLIALASLRPVFAVEGFSGAARAAALTQLVGCLSQFGRKAELDRTLTEADRLCGADESLDGDTRLLLRALVRVGISAHRRRHGDVMGAADAARTGLGLLEQLDDPRGDGGVVRNRLVLQLVCSLLDRGDAANALELAEPALQEAERAASVAPLGWLRMAVATRVLLPAGSVEAAAGLLREGIHSTERHSLHALTARLWTELAHVEERTGRLSEALECLRQSRASEHLHARARGQATGLLTGEFGQAGHAAVDLDEILGAESGTAASSATPAPSEEPVPVRIQSAVQSVAPGSAGVDGENGGGRRRRDDPAPVNGHRAKEDTAAGHGDREPELEAGRPAAGTSRAAEPVAVAGEAGVAESGERRRRYKIIGEDGESSGSGQGDLPVRLPRRGPDGDVTAERSRTGGRRYKPDEDGDGETEGSSRSNAESKTGVTVAAVGGAAGDRVGGETGRRHKAGTGDADTGVAADSGDGGDTAGSGDGQDTGGSRDGQDRDNRDSAVEVHGARDSGEARQDKPSAVPSGTDTAPAVVRPLPVRLMTTAEVDPPLAPAPADEPAPRVPPMSMWKAEVEPHQDESRPSRDEAVRAKTRHDAEHGSVAARSVLDRLGISTGSGGGRRRASGAGPAGVTEPRRDRDGTEERNGHGPAGTGGEPEERASQERPVAPGPRAQAEGSGATVEPAPGFDEPPGETGVVSPAATEARTGEEDADSETGTAAGAGAGVDVGDTASQGASKAAGKPGGSSGGDRDSTGANGEAPGRSAGESGTAGAGNARDGNEEGLKEKQGQTAIEAMLEPSGEEPEAAPGEKAPDGKAPDEKAPATADNWLPRLKLPPSLEPFEDYTDSALSAASATPFTSAPRIEDGELGGPFSADRSAFEDDLPPDAGLADLLARALAEHQAGTASAAALVKRLGNQGGDEPRPVNGHRRNGGGVTGDGRHRTDG
ncbi:hypothetical protein [Amycolatopsis rhizosphaerae]|uniref:hypothetical protein n=1 Tax=Amycolatopsis rhizosphaerae TaxID=2053003 RepID=UPI00319E129C